MGAHDNKNIRILLTGGGTLGSVMPLLAVWEQCGSASEANVLWIGTKTGPERVFIQRAGVAFRWIYGGKMRRYLSIRNIIDPFLSLIGIIQSMVYIILFRPDVVVHSGSFIGVPVVIATWLLRKRCIVWQLDIHPSLSNLLTAVFASEIAVSTKEAGVAFRKKNTRVVGIPIRKEIMMVGNTSSDEKNLRAFRSQFGIDDALPVLLVIGGGTGALSLNELVWQSLPRITKKMHVIHVTGLGKESKESIDNKMYHPYAQLSDTLPQAYAIADGVVTRAGMGTLSELAYLGKPSIVIPLQDSQQEKNAVWIEANAAARVLSHKHLTPQSFAEEVENLIADVGGRRVFSARIQKLFRTDAILMCSLIHRTKLQ